MAYSFRATTPIDVERLAAFLRRAFGMPEGAPQFDLDSLLWKYWFPRDDWHGSRSYVLEKDGQIEAHCALLPVTYRSTHGRAVAAHFIDWAADPRSMGAGVRVLRKVATLTEMLCAVGGSEDTRKILPLIGFRPAGEMALFACPVRPLRQAVTHQYRNWKLPLRLIRNALWSRSALGGGAPGWSFEPTTPDRVPPDLWSPPPTERAVRERSPSLYPYYLACPSHRFRLFLISHQGRPAGCCLIGFYRGQARIADLWLQDESPESYEDAYRVTLLASMTDPSVAEVVASTSDPSQQKALSRSGFREFRRDPIVTLPHRGLPAHGLDCQMLDNDSTFLATESPAYLT